MLDGLHRLEKATRLRCETVPAIEVSDEDLQQCLIAQQSLSLIQIQRGGTARIEAYQAKCTSCGACCSYFAREPAKIQADGPAADDPSLSYWHDSTHENKWPDGDSETVDLSTQVMKTHRLGEWPACIALQGEIGREVGCAIYETRPDHCRRFEPGSLMCLAARAWAGIKEETATDGE